MTQQKLSLDFLARHKKNIDSYLLSVLKKNSSVFEEHFWAADTFEYLESFIQNGKTIRGALILELISLLSQNTTTSKTEYLPLAAFVECIHAGLLIQDDFMDNDNQRRGLPSLHFSLKNFAASKNYSNDALFGTSLATCISDVCFFLGFGELSQIKNAHVLQRILQKSAVEYIHVGFAQMRDTHLGYVSDRITVSEIEKINRYKTARYTFSFPFTLAGIVCDMPDAQLKTLEAIGENIGIVFQLRDDYLSLFGDSNKTGKPLGSDVIENKKTLYRELLFQKIESASPAEQDSIKKLFGKKKLTAAELHKIQTAITVHGVQDAIDESTARYKITIHQLLEQSKLDSQTKSFIKNLTEFVSTRNA